jgi:hypothetical protein
MWSAASNADELTACTNASPGILAINPHDICTARHRQLLVVVVAGLQDDPGGGVPDRRQQ